MSKLNKSEESLIKQLQNANCLKKSHICLKCGEKVKNMVKRTRGKNGNELVNWRCEKCQAYKTVKDNSFFSLFRKPIWFILTLIKYRCVQLPIASAKDMLILDKD
jgi:hypothetical protein